MEHGASMVIAGYPIAYGKYATYSEKDFQDFRSELQSVLNPAIISDYTDYFYPYDYFYNTDLHLTKEGTTIRTDQLISDLGAWMSDRRYE